MEWFFERISTRSADIIFGSKERTLYTTDFEALIKLGIIKQTHNLDSIDCQLCDEPHETAVREQDGRLYYVCENGCGKKELSDDDLALYELNTPLLLSLFLQGISVRETDTKPVIDGPIWNLGTQSVNRSGYQLFFSRNLSEVNDETIEKIKAHHHPAVFYTGPSRATLPFTTVPLVNCIQGITRSGIKIDKGILEQYFPVGAYPKLQGGTTNKSKVVIDLVFPEQVQWEKVAVKVKEGMKEIEIFYDNKFIAEGSYIDLGLYTGTKQQKENREWMLLMTLSVLLATDKTQATIQQLAHGLSEQSKKHINESNVHGIKRNLDKSLQDIFQKDDNESAFHNYREKGYYEPRFTLTASPELRHEELRPQGISYDDEIAVKQ